MTEMQAHALAERLKRVWVPLEITQIRRIHCDAALAFLVVLNRKGEWYVALSASLYKDSKHYFCMSFSSESDTIGQIRFIGREEWFEVNCWDDKKKECFAQFAAQWLPSFRRGCWLSGCAITATAHEKMEWVQGFSREELEGWGLCF